MASWVKNGSNASSGADTVQLTTVAAGEAIFVYLQAEGGAPTNISVSDGTTSLSATPADQHTHVNSDLTSQWFYLASSVATGTVTYTATWTGGTPTSKRMIAFRFSYTGAMSFDTEAVADTNPSGTSHSSGNLTTTGSDEVVLAAYADYSGEASNTQRIFSTAADGTQATGSTIAWYRILSATAGPDDADCATANPAITIINAAAFKTAAAGSSSVSPSVSSSASASVSPSASVSASPSPSAGATIMIRTVLDYD